MVLSLIDPYSILRIFLPAILSLFSFCFVMVHAMMGCIDCGVILSSCLRVYFLISLHFVAAAMFTLDCVILLLYNIDVKGDRGS